MPYKASGNWVMVKKSGRWVRYKNQGSPGKAQSMARALNVNVTSKEKRRRAKR